MTNLTVAQLAALHGPLFTTEVKKSLRSDEEWMVFLDPYLIERTRNTLVNLVLSLETQIENYDGKDPQWLRGISRLRDFAKARLVAIPTADGPAPVLTSRNRETRAWKAFSAKVVTALLDGDYLAVDSIPAPYGNMTAREWINAREEKRAS